MAIRSSVGASLLACLLLVGATGDSSAVSNQQLTQVAREAQPSLSFTCSRETVPSGRIAEAAWREVGRLAALGFPVCDVIWVMKEHSDTWWRGFSDRDEAGNLYIVIDVDDPAWATEDDPGLAVRSLVRHEYAHTLVFLAGYYDPSLDATLRLAFSEPVENMNDDVRPGAEAAAEAVASVLATMRNDGRSPSYVKHVGLVSRFWASLIVHRVNRNAADRTTELATLDNQSPFFV